MRRTCEDAGQVISNTNYDEADMFEDDYDGTVPCALPFLREIKLFGIQQLYQNTFTHALGLSLPASEKPLPVLRQLAVKEL